MRLDQLCRHVVIVIGTFPLDKLEITAIDVGFFVRRSRALSTGSTGMKSRRMWGRAFAVAIVIAGVSKLVGQVPEKAETETLDESLERR